MFANRADAGKKLGEALKRYEKTGAIVLGIARGGTEVAYETAKALGLDLSVLVVRKLPFPDNPEAGFGALVEDGSLYLQPGADHRMAPSLIDDIVRQQQAEAVRRINVLRGGSPLPDLKERHVILIDDGIAMGSTTQAAVMCCRNLGARRVTVAAPVASVNAHTSLMAVADEVVILLCPPFFRAVAEFYQNWYDVSDEEVIGIMAKAEEAGLLTE